MAPEPIDLHHLGREHIIASYLLDTTDGPALFDCGPSTTVAALKAGLADRGLALTDVGHLLISHIHLDHEGKVSTRGFGNRDEAERCIAGARKRQGSATTG